MCRSEPPPKGVAALRARLLEELLQGSVVRCLVEAEGGMRLAAGARLDEDLR